MTLHKRSAEAASFACIFLLMLQSVCFADNNNDGTSTGPSIQDLGFTKKQAEGDKERQRLLDKRSHMLKIHQRLGLITTAPFLASLLTSGGATSEEGSNSANGRALHGTLGAVTTGMYITTAAFALRTPKIPGVESRGPIRLHKLLAWVHGTGMVLTPILGAMAYRQSRNGERVHGIASAHGTVAAVTFSAYVAAMAVVSIKF
jgi:hypothetical protein